jgi:hypothetical protein
VLRSKAPSSLGSQPEAYARLLAHLAQPGWICHGTVVGRPLRRRVRGRWVQKGPYYLWTGKRRGKTICHALSKAQYDVAKEAIVANRRVMRTLAKLHALTLERILQRIPGVQKRP